MSTGPNLRILLDRPLLESAQKGQHNYIKLMQDVLEKARFRVEFELDTSMHSTFDGYTLTHMKQPPNERGLLFRRVYHYPFWQIEQVAERWRWDIAKAQFNPDHVPPKEAARFYQFWQKRLFGDAPQNITRAGFIYVPLQGRLTSHRSFQCCSPIEMVEHTLAHANGRRVIATLHPKETYSASETSALKRLEARHRGLEIRTGDMIRHLQHCDFVVAQNSSAAFSGFFFGKPALLFGEIDFHHITQMADLAKLHECYDAVEQFAPDYAAYLWWFWQDQSINAGRPDAAAKIAARFRRFGWPME